MQSVQIREGTSEMSVSDSAIEPVRFKGVHTARQQRGERDETQGAVYCTIFTRHAFQKVLCEEAPGSDEESYFKKEDKPRP